MDIRFGPAGIPLSCKGRTLKDGVTDIHALNLNAMEIQLVRGVGCEIENLEDLGTLAEELDVILSVHAPYYMELSDMKDLAARSIDNLKWSGKVADSLGANVVVSHVGINSQKKHEKCIEAVVTNIRKVRDWYKRNKLSCQVGIETSGFQKVFGSLDDVLTVCKRVSGVVPVLNFAHIHAHQGGALKRKEDFQEIFDATIKVTKKKDFYCHFSGIEHESGNKKRCTPIKKGDMRFEPMADCILDNEDYNLTIISGSPLLEHDAVYMKVIFDRVQQKRKAKEAKENEKKGEKEEEMD